jgi:hypothetical protein
MKKLLLNWRLYLIGILFCIAIFCLFSEPLNNSEYWIELFIGSKVLAFLMGYIAVKLTNYWERKGLIDLKIFE